MTIPTYDFVTLLQTFAEHQVDLIVVGGVCAVLHGAPINTFDLDLVHSRAPDNLERLLGALQALDARYRDPAGRKLRPQLSHLASTGHQLLTGTAGPFDLLGTIGTGLGYPDLLQHTVELQVGPGLHVRVLDLAKLIEIKEQLGRDKDRAVLPILRRTLEEKLRGGDPDR